MPGKAGMARVGVGRAEWDRAGWVSTAVNDGL